MPRFAQIVLGPAGSGKSTYCDTIQQHAHASKRAVHVINLDPAAEAFPYECAHDVRDLISLDDVAEELKFGPNGGLVFCMEYLLENLDWLRDIIDQYGDDDYLVFDLPGQVELFTHFPVMRHIVRELQLWDVRLCAVYLIDSACVVDPPRFISGALMALSTMVQLEVPHVNVLSKVDIVGREQVDKFLEFSNSDLLSMLGSSLAPKFAALNAAITGLLDDYSMVGFVPLDVRDEERINDLLLQVDMAMQYGEDLEPGDMRDEEADGEEEGHDA